MASFGGEKRSSYLPTCWDDDERMSSLMSMFKRREVNPSEYDAKLRFWTDLIVASCSELRNPVFTVKQLRSRFQRKDRVPACLDNVVQHMCTKGIAVPLSDYTAALDQRNSWVAWGVNLLVKRPFAWVWKATPANNTNMDTVEFVLPNVVREIGEEILNKKKEAMEKDDWESNPLCQDVVLFSSLRHSCPSDRPWPNDRAMELALKALQGKGQVAVEVTSSQSGADRLIKFKEGNDAQPAQMTDIDRHILSVKQSSTRLQQEMLWLDQQITAHERDARSHVKAGNRGKAKLSLKHKLQLLKRLKEKEVAYDNLTSIMNQMARTKEQKSIIDAYKAGAIAFKAHLAKHGLSPENVDRAMDEIQEAVSDQEEVNAALAGGAIGFGQLDVSQEDLEKELEDLLEPESGDDVTALESRLPEVPAVEEGEHREDGRLKRLRRALESS